MAFKHLLLSVLLLLELFLALSACVFQLSASGIIFMASPRAVQGDDGLQRLSPAQSHTRGLGKCIPGGRYCSASIRKAEFAPKSTKRCWSVPGHSCSGSGEVTLSAGDPFPKGTQHSGIHSDCPCEVGRRFFWGCFKGRSNIGWKKYENKCESEPSTRRSTCPIHICVFKGFIKFLANAVFLRRTT